MSPVKYFGSLLVLGLLSVLSAACSAQTITVVPDHETGIYKVSDTVHWTITYSGGDSAPSATYVLKSGGATQTGQGTLQFTNGVATLDSTFTKPNTVLLEVDVASVNGGRARRYWGGAVADPDKIMPAAASPAEFDSFWKSKVAELKKVPANPQLTTEDIGDPTIAYDKITLDNIQGSHIQGQIARPTTGSKFPAVLQVQWAGVYGLNKDWVTSYAKNGWLAMNIEPHDIPIDYPAAYYSQAYSTGGALQNYWNIGNDDRETSYYLHMYLSCYQAIEYLSHRPDWNGKTLVVTGTSQGGQQTIMICGLHPKNITAGMCLVPAACDMLAPDAGRASGFPNWYFNVEGKDAAKVRDASRYYDPANFAPHIKCPMLIALGLRDTTAPPSSILATANMIKSPKQVMVLVKSGHQDENGTQKPYNDELWGVWLPSLASGKGAPRELLNR